MGTDFKNGQGFLVHFLFLWKSLVKKVIETDMVTNL
jgi:hypothetical protein